MFVDMLTRGLTPLMSIVFILCFAHIRFRRLKWKGPPVVAWLVALIASLTVLGQLLAFADYMTNA